MSERTDEDLKMIKSKYRTDVEIGGDSNKYQNLICSHSTHNRVIEYAIARGTELLICDGHSTNLSVIRRFDMEFDMKKIFYHRVDYSKHSKEKRLLTGRKPILKREFLVVCGKNRLLFIDSTEYHFYYYDIPFQPKNVFPVSGCVLIERYYDASTEQSYHYHDTFHLYSLSGPFGELLPVIYKTTGFQPHWKFCWQSHQDDAEMVGCAGDFVVVFDPKKKVHRIYFARETEEQEVQSAIRYVENQRKQFVDSTMLARSHQTKRTITDDVLSFQSVRSPAVIALSELIDSKLEASSPCHPTRHSNVGIGGFGHSTPNHPGGTFHSPMPTPIYEG
ncbi:unnamed protein product [Caenorhabditis bovis]|uniref:Uncharacterized protein n=1 Tax=Caenorhabditis bovis TaxID=2654633 RepID=A0A8S1EV68_9PELO|nr:unnamed protein product [Caenorhabditis bovis]